MSYGVNSAWGLIPVRFFQGAAWNDQTTPYSIKSGYATSLFRGDPVTASVAADGTITIGAAGDGNPILGSFMGCQYTDTFGILQTRKYWTGGTVTQKGKDATVFISDDPFIVYNVQSGAGAGISKANLLRNASLNAGAGGNTFSGLSSWNLQLSTIGTAADKQVKIIRLVPVVDNTNGFGVEFNNVEVVINNHYYKPGVASV